MDPVPQDNSTSDSLASEPGMALARFRFFPDLNEFLPHDRRGGSFRISFEPGQSLKHLVESAGVPHTEVGRLRANRQPVELNYQVQNGDDLEIYPAGPADGVPPGEARFVLDTHLGRLAAYLRMLGFDAVYRNDFEDKALAALSAAEDRILLTRDRRLLMRRLVKFGYCLRSLDSRWQVVEVLRRYRLAERTVPFQRCLRCNHPLEAVSKETVIDQLELLTKQYYDEFHRCPACGQIYWKGSHYERMQNLIAELNQNSSMPKESS
jgi:uncharacterized protein